MFEHSLAMRNVCVLRHEWLAFVRSFVSEETFAYGKHPLNKQQRTVFNFHVRTVNPLDIDKP